MRRLLTIALLSVFCLPLFADRLDSCNDGDTCRIKAPNQARARKVRLAGIDAPEEGQAHWKESRDFLVALLNEKELELECSGSSYGRATCRIFFTQDSKKTEVNEEMVKAGMAWNYPRYSGQRYLNSEKQAREKKLGLWNAKQPGSPFCFRHSRSGNCRSNIQHQP